jgi:hypothetical protein
VLAPPDERPGRPGAWTRPFEPLAGSALLDRLRTTGRARPRVEAGFAERLRSMLEAGISSVGDDPGRGAKPLRSWAPVPVEPLVVTRARLERALCCAAHDPGPLYGRREPSVALACGALVAVLFRQQVTVGTAGDPMTDALAALSLDERQSGLVSWIEGLTGSARAELSAEVERQAHALAARWPPLEPSWLPRTCETMRVGLAEGTVVLSARVDLAVGRPAEREASVAMVELVAGARRAVHRADRHFAALLETLRHAAPPFAVATYYTSNGELDVEPVSEDLLTAAARRVVAGVHALTADRRGPDRARGPAPHCASCAVFPSNASGEADAPGGRPPARDGS